jgi:hypothetical protein
MGSNMVLYIADGAYICLWSCSCSTDVRTSATHTKASATAQPGQVAAATLPQQQQFGDGALDYPDEQMPSLADMQVCTSHSTETPLVAISGWPSTPTAVSLPAPLTLTHSSAAQGTEATECGSIREGLLGSLDGQGLSLEQQTGGDRGTAPKLSGLADQHNVAPGGPGSSPSVSPAPASPFLSGPPGLTALEAAAGSNSGALVITTQASSTGTASPRPLGHSPSGRRKRPPMPSHSLSAIGHTKSASQAVLLLPEGGAPAKSQTFLAPAPSSAYLRSPVSGSGAGPSGPPHRLSSPGLPPAVLGSLGLPRSGRLSPGRSHGGIPTSGSHHNLSLLSRTSYGGTMPGVGAVAASLAIHPAITAAGGLNNGSGPLPRLSAPGYPQLSAPHSFETGALTQFEAIPEAQGGPGAGVAVSEASATTPTAAGASVFAMRAAPAQSAPSQPLSSPGPTRSNRESINGAPSISITLPSPRLPPAMRACQFVPGGASAGVRSSASTATFSAQADVLLACAGAEVTPEAVAAATGHTGKLPLLGAPSASQLQQLAGAGSSVTAAQLAAGAGGSGLLSKAHRPVPPEEHVSGWGRVCGVVCC